MDDTLLRSGRSTALRPDRAVSGGHRRTGFGKEHVNAVRTLMEEQEGRYGVQSLQQAGRDRR